MKITYPHMGYMSAPVANMLNHLGIDVIEAPPITKKTIELGTLHSPEGVCLPYKITIGTILEGLENGADTVVTMCGSGKCRFGFYNTVQKISLNKNLPAPPSFYAIDTNKLFPEMFKFLNNCATNSSILAILNRLGVAIRALQAMDKINSAKNFYGAHSASPNHIINLYEQTSIDLAKCNNFREIRNTYNTSYKIMQCLSHKPATIPPVKIGLIGEFYLLLEPYINHKVEDLFIKEGIEVKKFIYTGQWAYCNTILKTLGLFHEERQGLTDARPYMNYHVGGDGLKSVGSALWCAKNGYDGIVHVYPFGCMPEVVAEYSLKKISQDFCIPLLSLSIDEHASDVGILTRVEAFADCIKRKKSLVH